MPHKIEIILFQPQIPQNTGNILRTCVCTGAKLTVVHPLGFSLGNRWMKRAGLDYGDRIHINECEDLRDYLSRCARQCVFFSSHAKKSHYEVTYHDEMRLVFGSETEGLPNWVFEDYQDQCVRIPMQEGVRCLNLATSVGIGLYEALRGKFQGV